MPGKAKKTARKGAKRKVVKHQAKAKKAVGHSKTAKGKAAAHSKSEASAARKAPKAVKKINVGALKQAYSKSQIMSYLAESTELTKKDISNVLEALGNLMEEHLKSRSGPGEFTVPGLMKCVIKRKPATKARQGTNPFTGEPMTFKAKAARSIVKVRPLKRLKEMVA